MINRLAKNGSKSLSQLSHAIESATDGNVKTAEDWSLFMGICDLINTSEDGPKEAIKTFKKRFATKHQQTIVLTLSLLETCVKNCGKRFHVHLATKDFLQDFMKIINPKNNYSVALQNTVLGLLQTWAFAFQNSPELKEVNKTYQDLKNKGVEFPPLDPDKASPAYISAQSASVSGCVDSSCVSRQVPGATPGVPTTYHHDPHYPPTSTSSSSSSSSSSIDSSKIQKLKSELNTVQQNCKVFGELLTEVSQGGGGSNPNNDLELLEELNVTCRDMQRRILDLIQNTQIDAITDDLLHINDELNNEFVRYDRYKRMVKGNTNQPDESNKAPKKLALKNEGGGGVASQGKPSSVEVVDNLIDLNDSPSTGPTDAAFNSRMTNLTLQPNYNATGLDPFSPLQPQKDIVEVPFNPDLVKPEELQEMEAWLQQNEGTAVGNKTTTSTTDNLTATSSEFERFLADRASAATNLPTGHPTNHPH